MIDGNAASTKGPSVTSLLVGSSRATRIVGAALAWLVTLGLTVWMTACVASPSDKEKEGEGVGITGIDHLANHLSVQNFWVNGYNAARAGGGGGTVCCAIVPRKWQPGMKINIRWNVTNWRERSSQSYEQDVPLDRYDEIGQLYVHFLADGKVRALLSNYAPWGNAYPGPRDPIPRKQPWTDYPWSSDEK